MESAELRPLVIGAMEAAVNGDVDNIADNLAQIATSGDPFDMYAACCGLAEIGKNALNALAGNHGCDSDCCGDHRVEIQEVRPGAFDEDPHQAFAARFFAAYCNEDGDMTATLFKVALDAGMEDFVDSVCALVHNTAGIVRIAISTTAD